MATNALHVELDNSSGVSDLSAPVSRHSSCAPESVDHQSDVDSNASSDSSVTSDSSEESDAAVPEFPVLVSLESPLLAPIVMALNATRACSSIFANEGVDIFEELNYDAEWWRRASIHPIASSNTEEAWAQQLAAELQRLNAFIDGKMQRRLAASATLEELFRMKIPRLRERYLRVNDIFACLGLLPKLNDTLANSAVVDGEQIQLLPVGVNPELDGSTLQEALDDMFWTQALDDTDSDNPEDVPILDKLGDVVVVTCQSWNTQVDEQIWPERYTSQFLPDIQAKRQLRRSLKTQLRELQSQLMKLATLDGKSVPTSLETACRAMKNVGQEAAAAELRSALEDLQVKISTCYKQTDELDKQLTEESKLDMKLDSSRMVPYDLKGLVMFENEEDAATTVTLSRATPGQWILQSQNRCYAVRLEQALATARISDNYMAFYERRAVSLDEEAPLKVAPSVEAFCEADNATLQYVAQTAEQPESREESYMAASTGSSSVEALE